MVEALKQVEDWGIARAVQRKIQSIILAEVLAKEGMLANITKGKKPGLRQYSNIKKNKTMPGFNQTGPVGQGPMTGRRMGRCTNFGAGRRNEKTSGDQPDYPESESPWGFGVGRGRYGRGRGMGWRHRFRVI